MSTVNKHTQGEWKISESIMGETAIICMGKDKNTHIATLPMLSNYSAIGDEYKENAKTNMIKYCDEVKDALNKSRQLLQSIEQQTK